MNPGDTVAYDTPRSGTSPLNEGRGVNPGDTVSLRCVRSLGMAPLNEGRGVNPGDTHDQLADARGYPHEASLNEGRGVNPGDTCASTGQPEVPGRSAQRRPGREPRRHSTSGGSLLALLRRSTKAGA